MDISKFILKLVMLSRCFYAFSLSFSKFSWTLFALLVLKRRLNSSLSTVQQDFWRKDIKTSNSDQ